MEGFLDINYFQKYPREESLKQIMIDHEIIFKKQVHELHRMYAVQKSLMKGDSKYPICELFPMKRTFIETHPSYALQVGSTQFVLDQGLCARFQHKPLDLRLSTVNSYDDVDVDDDDDGGGDVLNLSLSIGRSTNKRSKISAKSSKNKIVYPSSKDIIDLEESTGTEFLMKNQDHLKIDSETSMSGGSFNQGSNGWHDVKQTVLVDLDLNKDQPDESSCHSNGSYQESCSQITNSTIPTLKQPKSQTSGQTKAYTIDLESLPEPSSNLTQEKDAQNEKEDSDYSLQKAAHSLISISMRKTSTINQDFDETKTGSNEIENKKKTITRSSSIDSYESLVLKLEVSIIDEDCVTSNAFKIIEFDQKENGTKLKRGRRMKDFQKDVLPTISSLSRHEIWEDVKILEGVIRSREYKRLNKAKRGKGENWFTCAKSKRSKVNYGGQKSN